MKFTLARPQQPRNPYVAPALLRRAGSHRISQTAERQRGRSLLAKEVQHAMSRPGRADHAPPEAHSP